MAVKQSLYVEPLTGGYELLNNNLAQVHPSVVKVNNLLCQKVGGYIFDLKSGNPLVEYTGMVTQSFIINSINISLLPLVNSNDLVDFTIISIISSSTIKNRFTISIALTLPNGESIVILYKQS